MIKYDKEKLNLEKITNNDLPYLKELLEGKYLKRILTKENEGVLLYIKSVNDLEYFTLSNPQIYKVIYDSYAIFQLKKDYDVNITYNCKHNLPKLFNDFSFATKEEFMNACNKVMDEIKKGVENE